TPRAFQIFMENVDLIVSPNRFGLLESLGVDENLESVERHRASKQHQVQTMKKQRLMLKRSNKAMWWRDLWNRYRKRDDVQTGEIPTPGVEVEDGELEDEEDDDGKTLVSDTDGTELEISEASGDAKEDEEFDTDSAVDEDENGSAPDAEQGKIKSSNLTLVSSDPSNIACNCDSDYLIADGICSVDVDLELGSANTEIQTEHLSLAHQMFDKMPQSASIINTWEMSLESI
ncbi:hypothetical protein U1Q18_027417, partial [Sarracenia purpurea var. burkii]